MSNELKQNQRNEAFFGLFIESIQDVEELSWENEESSMLSNSFRKSVSEFVRMGNTAFRQNRFDEAILNYSSADWIKSNDFVILRNRCKAFISKSFSQRSSSNSQTSQLSELDSTTYAGLALKDAEKLMRLEDISATTYILKAHALILLERGLELAHDAILSGLHVNPYSIPLRNLSRITSCANGRKSGITHGDFDCVICLKLMYKPITTPCGHSFCSSCLFQAMDICNKCPLCHRVLFVSPRTCITSVLLDEMIEKYFPEKYAERKIENDKLSNMDINLMMPLLVMDVVLPCEKFELKILEARYRLMVRRIMEGSRRFGMVNVDPITGSIADHACEVEITHCEAHPSGSFSLEVESRKRCRILRHYDQDGYQVAEIEWVQDEDACPGDRRREQVLEVTKKAAAWAKKWLKASEVVALRDQVRRSQLSRAKGLMPSTSDPESFSFWLTTLTNRRPVERLSVLRMRCSCQRLKLALFWMRAEELNEAKLLGV